MTWEMAIIAVVRVAGSLPVLRWAFVGGLIAVATDFSDLFLKNLLDLGGVDDYQSFDKYLDQVYLATFLVVALSWPAAPRAVAIALYAYRLVGFVAFEASGERDLLLLFPNVFEFWLLFVAGVRHWNPGFEFTPGRILVWGGVLLAVKEFQEYAVHGGRWFDSFTALEAAEAIWDAVTAPLR
jgi:hypothetical protein